jgi:predicted ATPase
MTSTGSWRVAPTRAKVAVPTQWSVDDFKSLGHVSIPLAPLVVLTGANSSGKSSIIQSLLLVAQSTDDEIILNGPLVRLGEPHDVIRSGSNSLTLSYSTLNSPIPNDEIDEWSFSTSLVATQSGLRVSEFHAAFGNDRVISASKSRVTSATEAEINLDGRFGDSLLHVKELVGKSPPPRTYISFRGFYPDALIFKLDGKRILASLRRNFRRRDFAENPDLAFTLFEELQSWWRVHEEDLPKELIDTYQSMFRRGRSPARLVFEASQTELDDLFKAVAQSVDAEGEEWLPIPIHRYLTPLRHSTAGRMSFGFARDHAQILRALSISQGTLRSLRESIRYLGPLREEPQVVSATGGRYRTVPAGTKGEYTADLLARAKNDVVQFKDWTGRVRVSKIPEAVSVWTTYLGVGDAVAVEDQGKLGRGLRVSVNGVERDLTTVGVGASQVLPVLTVVLAANPGSIVCLEQPEIHLHPAVQSRLADFFLLARPDLSIIVETHSEYMIARIRRRAAEDAVDRQQVSILFAEQIEGVTELRSLALSAFGELSDWPRGFFDTQEEEARALVTAVTRRLEESQNDATS